jgi:hypothetical protein
VTGERTNRQAWADSAEPTFRIACAPALCDGHNISTAEFDPAATI